MPKPDRVEKGSVIAFWNEVSASPSKPLEVKVSGSNASLPKGTQQLSTFATPTPKPLGETKLPQLGQQNSANATPSPVLNPGTGLVSAKENYLAYGIGALLVLGGLLAFAFKKAKF